MEDNGYDVMIYSRTELINNWNLTSYNKYPFWVAQYMPPTNGVETNEPNLPNGWEWTAWQFTSKGQLSGVPVTSEIVGRKDLNVMKKSYLDKYR